MIDGFPGNLHRSDSMQSAGRTTWKALLGGLVLFVLIDTVVFRTWLYGWVARSDSSAGYMALRTQRDPAAKPIAGPPSVVLLGDSRVEEGCDAGVLRDRLGGGPLAVRMAAIPATTPRVWPYLWSALPKPPGGYTVAVVGLSTYDDNEWGSRMSQRTLDLSFLGPLLTFAAASELAASFEDHASARRDVWLAALCKTWAWRQDLRDLLADPWQRYQNLRASYGRMRWGAPYPGNPGSLAGARVEGNRIVGIDDQATLSQLRQLVFPASSVDNHDYQRLWLGRLAERTAAAGTELVLVRMPTQVLPRSNPKAPDRRTLDELARWPRVHVLPHDQFAELERPEFFWDGLHLNRAGRERFTDILAEALRVRFPQLARH